MLRSIFLLIKFDSCKLMCGCTLEESLTTTSRTRQIIFLRNQKFTSINFTFIQLYATYRTLYKTQRNLPYFVDKSRGFSSSLNRLIENGTCFLFYQILIEHENIALHIFGTGKCSILHSIERTKGEQSSDLVLKL